MFSRKYLQNIWIAVIVILYCFHSALADEDVQSIVTSVSQNGTEAIGNPEGFTTESSTDGNDNEIYTTTTPFLSSSNPPFTDGSVSERPTVTVTPASSSMPATIITATKVTLDHRILSPEGSVTTTSTESQDSQTESPIEEATTNNPVVFDFPPENITSHGNPGPIQNSRKSRFHRIHEAIAPGSEESATEPSFAGYGYQETSTEYYRELEQDDRDNYGDFPEENEIAEQLPTPMALITPNGEGNNPPLEDDFAEAFKKVNSQAKRRRFRGGRRDRMRMKRLNNTISTTTTDSDATSLSGQNELNRATKDSYFDNSLQTTTSSPFSSTPRSKRFRSTTPASLLTDAMNNQTSDAISASESMPVVRSGPKPMILQNSFGNFEGNDVTTSPQLERPEGGAHTEKISTYFFSTPSPSSRLRLRQKMKESHSTTAQTTTTTEAPSYTEATFPTGSSDAWKDSFSGFGQNSLNTNPTDNIKIPAFVPMDLGLESDDRQDPIESAILGSNPPELENKAYSLNHHRLESSSHSNSDPYSSSSTTPRYHKVKKFKHGYNAHSSRPPKEVTEKAVGAEYYAQGSNTEQSTTFASAFRPPTGSHYDRTKDKVIFYKENPYSTQHSPVSIEDVPTSSLSPSSSQTVGSHLSIADGPGGYDSSYSPAVDHYTSKNHGHSSVYTPGKVLPAHVEPQLDTTFQNGPPDTSHIHSPNMVENSPFVNSGLQHHDMRQHQPHHTISHNDGGYSHAYIESAHQSVSRPGDVVYGTIEEVPVHGRYSHPNEHHMKSPGSMPYQYNPELSRTPNAPPPLSYPPHLPPPTYGDHSPQTSHIPPPPYGDHSHQPPTMPLQPPPPAPPAILNHHHQDHSFAPPAYEMHSADDNHHGPRFPLSSNHIAESPSEQSQGSITPNVQSLPDDPTKQSVDHYHDTTFTASGPSDIPQSPSPNAASQTVDSPPAEHAPQQLDNDFPPHSHTMAAHPDYEPANPPLPHDHPFHNNFVSFPNQDVPGAIPSDHGSHHDTNSISHSPYHPNTIEHESKSPAGFEPSSLIPEKTPKTHGVEFTPIPDDVKEHDLYKSYADKPYDTSSHSQKEPHKDHHESPPQLTENVHHHSKDHHVTNYLAPSGGSPSQTYDHYSPNVNDGNSAYPSSGAEQHGKDLGYSGPVTEIHSGHYELPQSEQNINMQGVNDPYHDHIGKIPSAHDHSHHGHHPHQESDKPQDTYSSHGEDFHGNSQHSTNSIGSFDNDDKKEGKKKAPFSNTPYVLMFPQLIPEEKMRPSPPSMLSKEIPVVQASSMGDFTSGEKPPLGPGFQAVPVHPRHQMYQVLAKTHYDKMMEKYMESKKRPPSTIYTPYGMLIPVGSSVADAASSTNRNVFAKPRFPHKHRGENGLLNALLGSSSTNSGRYHPPNGLGFDLRGNRISKLLEYEPAIDLLAEKLALKIVAAQQALNQKSGMGSHGSYSEHKPMVIEKSSNVEGKSPDLPGKSSSSKTSNLQNHEQMLMEMKAAPNPELKEYLKSVLKGQFTEMVASSGPVVEDSRRPVSYPSNIFSSLFRKGRVNLPSSGMLSSASMLMSNKVPPPPGMHKAPYHSPYGHHLPPPQPHGPVGLLGTIKRLFSFGPHERIDVGMPPNYMGRTLITNNGTYIPYVDGPSPRTNYYQQNLQSHGGMQMQQYQSVQQFPQMQSKHFTSYSSLPAKPLKKKKKTTKKPIHDERKWQSNRLTSTEQPTTKSVTTTVKPYSMDKNGVSSNNTKTSSHYGNKKTSNPIQTHTLNSASPKAQNSSTESASKNTQGSLSKRTGNAGDKQEQEESDKPAKLDMFQTILGSTRQVLNFFKTEGRKSGPTVLRPRSATTSLVESKPSRKKRSFINSIVS